MKIYAGWASTIVEQYLKLGDKVRPLLSFYHIANGNWKEEFDKFIEIKRKEINEKTS